MSHSDGRVLGAVRTLVRAQASGIELASMVRQNKTASRFNSTHALLDDPNAGVKGRVKDPALPHEMAPADDKP